MAKINGKEIPEILKELAEVPVNSDWIKLREDVGKYYIPDDLLKKRFHELIPRGCYNLSVETEEVEVKGARGVKAHLEITLIDDEGILRNKYSMEGYAESIFPKVEKTVNGETIKVEGERQKNHGNTIASSITDAWKKLLKNIFGIGENQLNQVNGENGSGTGKVFTLTTKQGKTYGEKGTFLNVSVEGSNATRLAIFSNKTSAFKKLYPDGIKANELIKIIGKENTDKQGNPQIIFEGFPADFKPGQALQNQTTTSGFVKRVVTTSNLQNVNGKMTINAVDENGEVLSLVFDESGINTLSQFGYLEGMKAQGELGYKFGMLAVKNADNSFLFKEFR